MKKKTKLSPYQDAVSYLYKKTPTKKKSALFKTSLFPKRGVPPDGAILMDGTEVRLVPTNLTKGKALYISTNAQGYSYKDGMFRAVKDQNDWNHGKKIRYRIFRCYFVQVHTAVLSAWKGPCPPGYQCDHINGNPSDNRLENLEWVTPAENTRRRWLMKTSQGLSYNGKKLTEIGKAMWRMRKKTAEKYGVSIELIVEQ